MLILNLQGNEKYKTISAKQRREGENRIQQKKKKMRKFFCYQQKFEVILIVNITYMESFKK